ncbi:MAG: glucosamine-6-phosphate deaminase [Cyanobium sp.]
MSPADDHRPAPTHPPADWTVIGLPDAESVARQVAIRLLSERRFRPERALGLATGRTMDPVYAALVQQVALLPEAEQDRLRERWLSFNLDEYVGLSADDPRGFRAAMVEHLVRPLGLDPERVRLPDGAAVDPGTEALRYARELATAGGIGLQVLGLGLNGHVGFNEPPCTPEAGCRCVTLCNTTRRANAEAFGGDPQAVPPQAITLGLGDILSARSLLLVVTGAAKAPILKRLLQGDSPSPELPASWLRMHPEVTVLADRDALGNVG